MAPPAEGRADRAETQPSAGEDERASRSDGGGQGRDRAGPRKSSERVRDRKALPGHLCRASHYRSDHAKSGHPPAAGRTYNLVGDEDTTVRQIADAVRDAVGDAEIVHTQGRVGDFAGARVSGARAADELGWHATTPFAAGGRRYVSWYLLDTEAVEVQ